MGAAWKVLFRIPSKKVKKVYLGLGVCVLPLAFFYSRPFSPFITPTIIVAVLAYFFSFSPLDATFLTTSLGPSQRCVFVLQNE